MKPEKLILTIFATMVLTGGCGSYKAGSSFNECIDCQGLKNTLKYFREKEHAEKVVSSEGEMPWEEFEKIIIQSAGCCEGFPHPLSKEWKEYDRLDCIWEYLEKENVQRIAFCRTDMDKDTKRPEDWNHWAEIVEPKKINEVLELIREAMEKEKDKFADRWSVLANADSRMQIITDKHKFIIPICGSSEDEAIYGLGWISCKLRKKLTDWGYAKPVPEKECRTLKCVLEYLEEENIQRIDFYQSVVDGNKVGSYGVTYPSFEWHLWGEIIEPQKINKVLKLLRKELKRGEDRIDEEGKTYNKVRMQIVTGKQKYIIPIFLDGEAAYGVGWTSYELKEQLRKWGFDESKDANTAPAEQ